ncbi:MAG: exodeoxyribonuclease III, partial [Bacteroidales bacterium]
VSYNVNGIRAAMTKNLIGWIKHENPDIICFQEIKALQEQIDEEAFRSLGYNNLYWFSAEKKGYSGTAILSKVAPKSVDLGMQIPIYDQEGRLIRAEFEDFTLICSYFPSGTTGDERQTFKMQYLADFSNYIVKLQKHNIPIIICGDINICRQAIDINNPTRHEKTSGFLPEERTWFQSFIDLGFIDTFRLFNNESEQYSWWSYRSGARPKNLGWRIDYFLCSRNLEQSVVKSAIHQEAIHSDHCPISIVLK